MKPKFFATPAAFRKWLEKHHDRETELLVGFYKKGSGKPSITWPESVDQALCFGWIDGVRHSIDDDSYSIRFTPRKPKSNWSKVNIARAQELLAAGLMHPAGRRAFANRDAAADAKYSFEREHVELDPAYRRQLHANQRAAAFFEAQPPSYRRTVTWWIMSAKQEATRQRRLDRLIADSAAGQRIAETRRPNDA